MNEKFSKIGFILAVAGGAVGLGNAFKFPTLVGSSGGSAFVFLYLTLTLTIGFSVFLAEMAMGRLSGKDPVNAYKILAPKNGDKWKFAGFFMIAGIFVLAFYLIILGWVIRYIAVSFANLPSTTALAGENFENFITNSFKANLFFYLIAFLSTFAVVARGIKSGIEKLNIYMMPLLFILLLIMLIYSCFMDGFSKAAVFLFTPDFSKIDFSVVLNALGLAFFTLCIGIGCITTYAANLGESANIVKSSISIVFINILIGLMVGLIVFTFVFEFGADPGEQGVGLVFVSLTSLFAKLGFIGNVLAVLFFISLFFAGITSAISMIEPFVFYLINSYKISRLKAVIISAIGVFVLSLSALLSIQKDAEATFTFFGKSFFDILDFVSQNLMLPLGAMMTTIFVGFIMRKTDLKRLYTTEMGEKGFTIWINFLRFVVPICIIIIFINQIWG